MFLILALLRFVTSMKDRTARIIRAVDFFKDPDTVDKVRKRIMKHDHSWLKSAKKYRKLYDLAVERTGMELTKL